MDMKFITVWDIENREVMNRSLAFRLKCHIMSGDILEIVAISVYRLFVNNKLVGYGPARAAHGYLRFDEIRLDASEEAIIVAEVFGSNVNSYYLTDEKPLFGVNIIRDGKKIYDTMDFRCFELTDRMIKSEKYSYQRPFAENYKMIMPREKFYLGEDIFPAIEVGIVEHGVILDRCVNYPRLSFHPVTHGIERGLINVDENRPVWQSRNIEFSGGKLKGYKRAEMEECMSDEVSKFVYEKTYGEFETGSNLAMKSGEYASFAMGETVTGFIDISVKVLTDSTIYCIWDEILYDDAEKTGNPSNICFFRNDCANIVKYKLKRNDYRLLSFEPTSAGYLKLIVLNGEVELEQIGMVDYENPDCYGLSLRSDDQQLNQIFFAGARTLAQNSVDLLTDCPSRERAGWLCDSYFSGRAERFFTGKNIVERNFLENFILAPDLGELPEGMMPMCYPANHYDGVYIPNWPMWFVLELKNYLDSTGDMELVNAARTKVYGLIRYFDKFVNEYGLLEDLENWVFIEWSNCNNPENIAGVNYPSNMIFAAMLKTAGELYEDKTLIDRASLIQSTIQNQAYNGEFFVDNSIRVKLDGEEGRGVLKLTENLTETCQYYAFYFGTADRNGNFSKLFQRMVNEFGPDRDEKTVWTNVGRSNAIVGNYLRLELLLEAEYYNKVIEECRRFFLVMAEKTNTLWEHNYEFGSLNHGFASIAAKYIADAIEKINPR